MKKLVSALLVLVMLAAVIGTTSGCQKTDEKVSQPVITTPLLRIGILSDTYINADTRYSMYDRLEKALMFYKKRRGWYPDYRRLAG